MELPKNITQIGESDRGCKIYVEDYVISYIKQMNRLAQDKQLSVALYGKRTQEDGVSYLFFYGAGRLETLTREVRHLSQAQTQEIDKIRKRYFPEYEFLGYRLLNGEMVEGFHVSDQGSCRYIQGYACFYEKNDSMLAYMLDTRGEEIRPEEVDIEKYDQVRQRQEERRQQFNSENKGKGAGRERNAATEAYTEPEREEASGGNPGERSSQARSSRAEATVRKGRTTSGRERPVRSRASGSAPEGVPSGTLRIMRGCVVGMFALLCVVGVASLSGGGKLEQLRTAAGELIEELTEKKLPDENDAVPAMNQGQTDTLVAEDKLADAIMQENAGQPGGTETGGQGAAQQPADNMGQASGQDTTPQITEPAEGQAGQAGTGQNTGQLADQTGTGQQADQSGQPGTGQPTDQSGQPGIGQGTDQSGQSGTGQPSGQPDQNTTDPTAGQPVQNSTDQSQTATGIPEQTVQQAAAPVSYTIRAGDTLIGICTRNYGSDARLSEICELNQIANPDNIRIGQKILLPQ